MDYYLASKLSFTVLALTIVCIILVACCCMIFFFRRIMNTTVITLETATRSPISPSQYFGLSPKSIEMLPVFVYKSSGPEKIDCVICLSEMQDGEKGRRLPPCGHIFHADCVDVWFRAHSTCPICRTAMDASFSELLV